MQDFDTDENDTDVAILAEAIEDVKRAAADILANQHNIMMPDLPLVSVAAPNFVWSAIAPDACEEEFDPHCEPKCDALRDSWHHIFELKISDAIRKAGFRREIVASIDVSMQTPGNRNHSCPIAPAGYAAFWTPRFNVGAPTMIPSTADREIQHGDQPAVAIELTNATLSLWAYQKCSIWSPWSTRPQYGTHQRYEDVPGYMSTPQDPVWTDITSMIHQQREDLALPDSELLHVYLVGDAWRQDMVDAFRSYLSNHGHTEVILEFRGMFAASDGAASLAQQMLETCRLYGC